ncbi:hypothetical protein E2C01_099216 [Portunus trituberculatus]|uniref:Secreted protein n=1 Tax=Portunus trituberculatus TaxID=210409 RepID=A0A5B7KG98_PORTR|nr:hypothetical protein [Portunus trituberculatus]
MVVWLWGAWRVAVLTGAGWIEALLGCRVGEDSSGLSRSQGAKDTLKRCGVMVSDGYGEGSGMILIRGSFRQ